MNTLNAVNNKSILHKKHEVTYTYIAKTAKQERQSSTEGSKDIHRNGST